MRPLMIIFGFRLDFALSFNGQRRQRAVDRPEDPGASLVSRPAMSCPRLPARSSPDNRGRRLIPSRDAGDLGACIDGEDRIFSRPALCGPAGALRFEPSVRRLGSRPAPGTGASRRDRPPLSDGRARHVQEAGVSPPTGESTVDRAEKKEAVASLHEVFSKTSVVVVAQYSGLTVAQMQRLRKQMRQVGRAGSGRQEPPRPDCSQRHGRRLDRPPSQGADPDRSFERSGGGGQGSRGFRQGSREIRAPGRRHGQDGARRRWGQVACDLALARRTARQVARAPRPPRRPNWLSWPTRPPPRSPAWWRPMPPKTQPEAKALHKSHGSNHIGTDDNG